MKIIKTQIVQAASQILFDRAFEIEMALLCILARGHMLIEDAPGTGKTTLVQLMARLTGLEYKRIQFTNDLLPSDVLGNSVYETSTGTFTLRHGPIFAELVLADELNRASPRTQSALLQAMEEQEVTIDGRTHRLPNPFVIFATQNPQHQIGTSPLPESQIDRFMISLEMTELSKQAQIRIIQGTDSRVQMQKITPIIHKDQLLEFQRMVEQVQISDKVATYISALVDSASQLEADVHLSIRAGLALARAARAYAFSEDRKFVIPDDVQYVATQVLAHRLSPLEGLNHGVQLAKSLIKETPVAV